MAISDKVKVGMTEYVVPATILVEFAAIAALAWRLGGWVWSVAAMAMVAVLLLFALAFCKAAKAADPDGADDWVGRVMWMKSKGGHMARNPRPIDGGLAIMVAAAAPMGAIVSLALGCYIGLSAPEVLAVAFLFTALLTIYAVTVRALCLEYRKSGLAD